MVQPPSGLHRELCRHVRACLHVGMNMCESIGFTWWRVSMEHVTLRVYDGTECYSSADRKMQQCRLVQYGASYWSIEFCRLVRTGLCSFWKWKWKFRPLTLPWTHPMPHLKQLKWLFSPPCIFRCHDTPPSSFWGVGENTSSTNVTPLTSLEWVGEGGILQHQSHDACSFSNNDHSVVGPKPCRSGIDTHWWYPHI